LENPSFKMVIVVYDENARKDYLTGFHKRKVQRRKVAEKQLEEKARRKRIEDRKERRLALKAQTASAVGESDEQEEEIEEPNEESFQEEDIEVINGIKFKLKNKKSQKFETEDNTITTTVAEINFEEEEDKPLNSRKRNFVQMKTSTPVAEKPKKKADVNGKAWKKARSQRKSNQNQKKFKKYKKPNSDKKKTGNDKKKTGNDKRKKQKK